MTQLLAERRSCGCSHCAGTVLAAHGSVGEVTCSAHATFNYPTRSSPKITRETDGTVAAKGKLTMTFATPPVSIKMASPPPGLSACEKKLYQETLENQLKPHEQEHKRRYQVSQDEEPTNSYRGTHTEEIDDTGATAAELGQRWKDLTDAEFQSRMSRSQSFATEIDPFNQMVDTSECESAS